MSEPFVPFTQEEIEARLTSVFSPDECRQFDFSMDNFDEEARTRLVNYIESEARRLYNGLHTNPLGERHQTLDDKRRNCRIGSAPEHWLVNNFHGTKKSWKNTDTRYKDVLFHGAQCQEKQWARMIGKDANALEIECKASTRKWTDSTVRSILTKINAYNNADFIIFWHMDQNPFTGVDRWKCQRVCLWHGHGVRQEKHRDEMVQMDLFSV